MHVLHQLTGPLCKAIHDMEGPSFWASFLMPMFLALERDIENWCNSTNTKLHFTEDMIEEVMAKVHRRWEGQGNVVDLKLDQYVVAWLLDPYTSPAASDLPINWLQTCRNVLQHFYRDEMLRQSEIELNWLIAGEGSWGEYVMDLRASNKLPFDATNDSTENGFYVESAMIARKLTLDERPDLLWKNIFQPDFPLLYEVARHVLVMSTQSADVECLCKAHKLIHTTMCNHLKNATVLQLIYCYINLRLLNNQDNSNTNMYTTVDDPVAVFLEQAISEYQT